MRPPYPTRRNLVAKPPFSPGMRVVGVHVVHEDEQPQNEQQQRNGHEHEYQRGLIARLRGVLALELVLRHQKPSFPGLRIEARGNQDESVHRGYAATRCFGFDPHNPYQAM